LQRHRSIIIIVCEATHNSIAGVNPSTPMSCEMSFSDWLNAELENVELDPSVYAPFISCILEDPEQPNKMEDITTSLNGATEADVVSLVERILKKWEDSNPANGIQPKAETTIDEAVKALDQVQLRPKKVLSSEEQARREAFILTYGNQEEITSPEDSDLAGELEVNSMISNPIDLLMEGEFKNTNAADVETALKAKRDQAKLQHLQKVNKEKALRSVEKLKKEAKKNLTKEGEKERKAIIVSIRKYKLTQIVFIPILLFRYKAVNAMTDMPRHFLGQDN